VLALDNLRRGNLRRGTDEVGTTSQVDRQLVEETIRQLDQGIIRSARPLGNGWVVSPEIKAAIVDFMKLHSGKRYQVGPFHYSEMSWPKNNLLESGVRVKAPAMVDYGAYLSPGVILMPSQVNIGAWIGPDTMIDTWASVGTCAQIGARVHLAAGAGIGGVMEPEQDRPVVVEDDVFIGSRAVVTEGVIVRQRAVLGANVVLTRTVPIIDATDPNAREYRGEVPAEAIVIPGTRSKQFPGGEFQLACALIVGWRGEKTDHRVALNHALRQALAVNQRERDLEELLES
jgi:2,3,4,5-tetrahydropyridine-2,6-dicarboxylate N-succinyltransferase